MVGTTEEKLFGSVEIYQVIVDAAEEGIWIADRDDKVTFVNKKLVDMLGYPRTDIIGRKIFDFTDERNRAIMKESIERSRRGERDTYVFSLQNKNGGFIPTLVATTPMQDEHKRYIGTVQLCSDMSVQKVIEDDLREAKARADMYLDLLSHDIKNVDQVAMGYLEMALNKLDTGESLTEKDRVLIEIPFRSLQSSAELIATLKNMEKIKTANIPVERLDLGDVVTGIVNDIASVPGKAINIHYKPVKNCWVNANYLLKEVFINLIGNAIKHSYGPLDINIGIGTVTSNGNKYYAVTVEDNGPGMPDSLKSQVLSRHYCEEEKTLSKGAGLCLVKALVERFHGKVTVEDRVQGDYTKGARFMIMLPAVEK